MRRHAFDRARWVDLNPRARPADYRRARRVAESVAPEYARRGARAVVFAGSWVRGDAHRASDIDLWVLGSRRSTEMLWRPPFMVSVNRTTEATERRRLRDPARMGGSVPGWRVATPLYDPHGTAAGLKSEARRFRWQDVTTRCDRWVARSLVEWAEEAVKLVRAMAEGELQTAAVQRNLLADGLGLTTAIHRRLFWDSENGFWERLGEAMGGRWQHAQRRALGEGTDLVRSVEAALDLYRETALEAWECLDRDEQSIVAHACRVMGHPIAR